MAVTNPDDVQLLLVSFPDSGDAHLWLVAAARNNALKTALRSAPIGSEALLIEERLPLERLAEMNLRVGDVRDLGVAQPAHTMA